MSALGDYIHLYKKHYAEYGVTRHSKGSPNPNYSMNVINNRISANVKPISKEAIAELERRLKINSDNEENRLLSEAERQKQHLINICYQLLYQRSKNITGANRIATMARGGEVWYTDNEKRRYTKNLGNRSWAAYYDKNEKINHATLKALSDKANALYKRIQRLIDKINKNGDTSQTSEDFIKLVSLFNEYSHLSLNPQQCTLGTIKSALKTYRYEGAAQDISGHFGEMMVAICDDTCSNLAESQVRKHITESIVGAQTAKITFDKKLISTGYKIFDTNRDNENQYWLGATQNKVDVQINIKDEEVLATVKASADTDKAPRPHLQDVDLLVTLTFLNNLSGLENFGNHWLNMHATILSNEKTFNSSGLDEILKKEIAYEALASGNPFKQNVKSANIFAYINRATGQVYVKSVQQLLDNMDRIGGLKEIPQLRYRNNWQPEIWQRINSILTQVHQTKIHVAINIDFK